jgi:hypothetical protein
MIIIETINVRILSVRADIRNHPVTTRLAKPRSYLPGYLLPMGLMQHT